MTALAQLGDDDRRAAAPERRLSHRIFLYWLMRCGEDPFCAPDAVRPEELGDDWDWCFLLDVEKSQEFPFFIHLGRQLARFSGVLLSGRDWSNTLLDKATAKFREALEDRAPVMMQEEVRLFDGRELLFRSILLPLSSDGRNVTHVLGAANGKVADRDYEST